MKSLKELPQMKLLQALKRIAANEIIASESIEDINAYDKVVDNDAEMAFLVGGLKGMNEVRYTLYKRLNGFD
jgi:hypothetical protein